MEEASTEDSANQLYRETRLLEVGPHMCMYGMAVDGAAELKYDAEQDGWYMGERLEEPAAVMAVLVTLLAAAFIVLRYLDKRKKLEPLKEKHRAKQQAKWDRKNEKRITAGKPPLVKKEKPKKVKPAKQKVPKEQRKKLTPQEKRAAKTAAKGQKLRDKSMKSAEKSAKKTDKKAKKKPEKTSKKKRSGRI